MKKIISIILALAMLLGMCSINTFAASPEVVTQLADDLYFHQNSFYSESVKGDVNEYYFNYSPNSSVTPYLCHGNDVAGAASANRVFNLESEAGNTLIALVNADYYIISNGVPIGIEIKDGVIKSNSHSEFPEIGFDKNGNITIGRSNLTISLTNTTQDITFNNIHYNKGLTVDSVPTLYSAAFEDTNRADYFTTNVLIEVEDGKPHANDTITGVVKDVFDYDTKYELSEGEMLLAMYSNQDPDTLIKMTECEIGDEIEIEFSMDKSWNKITQAFGGKEILVENGQANKFSDNSRCQCTAIGYKSNGDTVLYTCDGRGYGDVKGLTLTELARRMAQFGCVEAVNLDGGTSTQVHLVYPGNTEHERVNATTSVTSCANYICFKNNEKPTGDIAHLFAYPSAISLAADSEIELNIKACDSNWFPVEIDPEELDYETQNDLGYVENGKFFSGSELGGDLLTVSYGKVNTKLTVTVKTDWPEITASYAGGRLVGTITDPLGEGIDEDNIRLTLDGKDYDFVYGNGVLSADFEESDGLLHHVIITAENSKGHISRFALAFTMEDDENVETDSDDIFVDVNSSNWAKPYIEYLYRNNIISGSVKNDKLYYKPSAKMTRQEFAKVITSWYGVDLDAYEYTELEFADNAKIANWALPYVKAAIDLGFMNGKSIKGSLNFDPEGSITRQEVMTVIGRIMGDGYQVSNLKDFKDKSKVADWALPYVKLLVEQGIITGSNGMLNPNNSVTREQVAKIIFEIN